MLANRSIPRCTVIPQFLSRRGEGCEMALAGCVRIHASDGMGSHRAQLNVGDGAVVLMAPRAGMNHVDT